jgi:hypothetical protein
MLITALKREKQEYYDRGRREIAIKMLAKGFDLELIAELTGLAGEEILRLQCKIENDKNV